ncbi:MAG: hypothetical protein WA628_16540 [Terriglobales bacterium]|jgi:hypothetical protein
MKRNTAFAMIVVVTLLVGVAVSRLAFNYDLTAKIAHKPLLIVLFVLAASAIYPLYRLERSWPAFTWGINFVLAGLLLTMCSVAGPLIGFSGTWTELVEDVSEALFLIGMLILVWKAATKKGQPKLKT